MVDEYDDDLEREPRSENDADSAETRPARRSEETQPTRSRRPSRVAADEDVMAGRQSRAQRRSAWVLTALALLLAGAFVFALLYNFSGQADKDAKQEIAKNAPPSSSTSTAPKTPAVEPSTVKVSVLNSTPRAGLARTTSNALTKQGFSVVEVGNAKPVQGVAVIRFGVPGKANASEVAKRFPGAVLEQDARKDPTVTVVLGPGFKAVTDPDATATKKP